MQASGRPTTRAPPLCAGSIPNWWWCSARTSYDGLHLKLMPGFTVIQPAEAMDNVGGFPGRLDIPADVAIACAEHLVEAEFDVAVFPMP